MSVPITKILTSLQEYSYFKQSLMLFLFFFLFFIVFMSEISAKGADIWLIADRLALETVLETETPALDRLQKQGAFSLVNVRTVNGEYRPESTYLSIGSSGRARGKEIDISPVKIAGDKPGEEVLVNPYFQDLIELNKDNTYRPNIGYLGSVLREKERKIAILGNSDTGQKKQKNILSLAQDDQGQVPEGQVDNELLSTTDYPWGYETDWPKMLETIEKFKTRADLILIEVGDFSRVEEKNGNKFQKNGNMEDIKREYLQQLDTTVGKLLNNMDLKSSHLGIMVPTPPQSQLDRGNKLSWLLLSGPLVEPGWLYSFSTRSQGILTINNLAPTIAAGVGIDDQLSTIRSVEKKVNWQELNRLNQKIVTIDRIRPPFIQGFIILQLVAVILGVIALVTPFRFPHIINIFQQYLLMILFLIPLNFLFISQFYFTVNYFYLLLLFLLVGGEIIIIEYCVTGRKAWLKKIICVAFATIMVLLLDLLFGSPLMADSLFGYSSIIGARFYGIGNEYMGIFAGGCLVGVTGLLEIMDSNYRQIVLRWIFPGILLLMVLAAGGPWLGANFGGALSLSLAVTGTYFYIYRYKLCMKTVKKGIILVTGLIFLVLMLNYYFAEETTHIGNLVSMVLDGERNKIMSIISRKLAMNLKLLRWTIWTRILLGFVVYLLIIFVYPRGKIRQMVNYYPYLTGGIFGGICGGLLAMLVNDSGVVAAATMFFFPVLTVICLGQKFSTGRK